MANTSSPLKTSRRLVFTGLFIIGISQICSQLFHLNDFLTGALMGAGIAMEMIGIVRLVKAKQHREP